MKTGEEKREMVRRRVKSVERKYVRLTQQELFEVMADCSVEFWSPFWLTLQTFHLYEDDEGFLIYGHGSNENKDIGRIVC